MTTYQDEDQFLAQIAATSTDALPVAKRQPAGTPKAAPKERVGFATEAFRVIAGGTRDAVQGTLDAADDIAASADAWTYRKWGVGTYFVDGQLVDRKTAERLTGKAAGFQAKTWVPKVTENQTAVGRFGRDVVEFGAGFATGMKALKGMEVAGTVARMSRPLAAGAVAAFNNVDPMQGNLLNMAKQLGVPESAVTEALAVDEDDEAIVARLKNAAADAVGGVAFDAALKTLGLGVRQLRALKTKKADLEDFAAVPDEALRHAPEMDAQAAKALDETFAPQTPEAAPKAMAEDVGVGEQQSLFKDELPAATKPNPVDELEQSLYDIPSKVEGLDEDALTKLATALHKGGDYEVLERLGLNPARIDFAKVLSEGEPGVARISEVIERIAEAVQPLADRAGSKPRSWSQTAQLAALVGADKSQVVAAFKGATSMLDAKAWAARQMLGGSAARLTGLAERARDFIDAPAAPQYVEFLKALEAHAALQAQFKAATSNVGRALNSLKGTATASSAVDKARRLRSLVPDTDLDAVASGSVNKVEDALRALGDAKTPDQRRRLIDKIIKAKGDTAAVTKLAAQNQGPARWQRATREFVTGNLFSVGTASVNILSTAGHIGFRAMSRLPVHGLAFATGKAGGRDYVAARLADHAYVHTILPGFARGFSQTMRLLSDDLTEELQGIAGSFGDNAVERGLGRLRDHMNTKWGAYEPRFQRADAVRSKEWRVSKETVEALMDNTDQLPALMRMGMRGLVGLGTGAFNATGAVARSIRVLTIDTTDELMGAISQQTTMASEAARVAALEGFDRGLSGDALAKFTRQRADVLLSNSSDEMLERAERLAALGTHEGSKEAADLAAEALRSMGIKDTAEAESRKVLFQDDLNWEGSKAFGRALPHLDFHTGMIFPFIKTPLKILETTLGDYTPLGLLQKDMRDKLMSGGVDAQVAATQIAMGTLAIGSAMSLAAGGYVVGYDGGPRSSTRMERPSYSMKVGGKWVEFSRFDPFGMLLGLGADMHEKVLNTDGDDGEPGDWQADRALSGMMLAISRNILSKTWMTTMRDVVGASGGTSDAQTESALERLGTSIVQKVVPAGGMMRWWEGTDDGVLREASTAWEKVMQSTPWADELPVRRDPLLGRPVKYDRILGIQAGDDDKDPLVRAMADLAFDLPPNSKSFRGVELNTQQLARLKELRGQVVEDDNGLTMEATLRELIGSTEWAEMDRQERIKAVRSIRDDYQPLAIEALRAEDRTFDHAVGEVQLRRKLEKDGLSQPEISTELQRFKEEVLGQ